MCVLIRMHVIELRVFQLRLTLFVSAIPFARHCLLSPVSYFPSRLSMGADVFACTRTRTPRVTAKASPRLTATSVKPATPRFTHACPPATRVNRSSMARHATCRGLIAAHARRRLTAAHASHASAHVPLSHLHHPCLTSVTQSTDVERLMCDTQD